MENKTEVGKKKVCNTKFIKNYIEKNRNKIDKIVCKMYENCGYTFYPVYERSPLDIDECPCGYEVCNGDCCYYTEEW